VTSVVVRILCGFQWKDLVLDHFLCCGLSPGFSTRSERLLFDSLARIVFSSFFALHFLFVRCVACRFIPCAPSVLDTAFAPAHRTMGGPVSLLQISLHP
jgi:hypothetical protein